MNWRSFGYGGDLAAVPAVSSHIATPAHCKMVTTPPGSAKAKPSQKSLPLFTKHQWGEASLKRENRRCLYLTKTIHKTKERAPPTKRMVVAKTDTTTLVLSGQQPPN